MAEPGGPVVPVLEENSNREPTIVPEATTSSDKTTAADLESIQANVPEIVPVQDLIEVLAQESAPDPEQKGASEEKTELPAEPAGEAATAPEPELATAPDDKPGPVGQRDDTQGQKSVCKNSSLQCRFH
jgi:hypothetical protein